MGVSTDALLLYGVPLTEDEGLNFDEDNDDALRTGPAYMNWSGNAEDGCEIISHSHCDYPMYFVAIEGTLIRAWRGHPQEVSTREPEPDWNERLEKFCQKHNLAHGKPGWYMASDWC